MKIKSMRHFYSAKANRTRRTKGKSNAFGLSFETLEDRRMLAAVTVNTAADLVDGNTTSIASLIADPGDDGAVSLREALAAADSSVATDTITFDADVFNGEAGDVIRLQNQLVVFQSVDIDGGDLGIVISGDTSGNDITENGSFVTDTTASDSAGVLADNTSRVFAFVGAPGVSSSISGLTITGGAFGRIGGGILVESSDLSLNQSIVSGNRATDSGGGIEFGSGQLTIDQSTISDNVVQAVTGLINASGGGVANSGGDVVISNSTISGNLASGEIGQGGGVFSNSGNLTLTSSTVSGNAAASPFDRGDGGGVFASSQSLAISDSTITANFADFGGGIAVESSSLAVTLDLANSIVAGNTALSASADITTEFTVSINASSSLVGDNNGSALVATSGGADSDGNLIGTSAAPINPLLEALADNGGLTETHALSSISPAVDTGSSALNFDQRGIERLSGRRVDIGAFELEGSIIVVDTSQGFGDDDLTAGNLSLPEAIALANSTPENETIVFDPAVFDGESADVIRLQDELFISSAVTIDARDLDVVISGDTLGDDTLIAGTFITDTNTFESFTFFDNHRVLNIDADDGDTVLRGLTITGGSTDFETNGAGIFSQNSSLVVEESNIAGNFGQAAGGGIAAENGSLIISNSVLADNSSFSGGAVFSSSADVTITGSTLTRNFADSGGGVFSTGGLLTISTSTVSDNTASQRGGGIHLFGATTILDRSTVSNNQLFGFGFGGGGGVFIETGSLTVSNSTISGNSAENLGGDGINLVEGDVTVTDSTITENNSGNGRGGSGVALDTNFGFELSSLTVVNSIIANNGFDDLLFNVFEQVDVDVRSSLIGTESRPRLPAAPIGSPDANGNIIGDFFDPIDPLLGELADNGGPTQTHSLLIGSPAIDSGNNVSTIDQRGEIRPNVGGNGADIGAVEEQSLTLTVDTSNDLLDGDFSAGNLSLREAIERANVNEGVDRITFDDQVFNGDAEDVIRLVNGELEITEGVMISTGELQIVVSGDASGNDVFNSDTFVVDVIASESNGSLADNSRVFNIATSAGESVSLSGLTITGGNASEGGGGIAISSAIVDLNGVNVSGNQASGSGGGVLTDSQIILNDSTVSGNIASNDGGGGGIAAGSGVVTVNNTTVNNNSATGLGGGGIFTTAGDVFLNSSMIQGNTTTGNSVGGGIATGEGAVAVTDSSIANNISSSRGGGVSTQSGTVSLTNSSLTENLSNSDGGGIDTETGTVLISESTLSGNVTTGPRASGGAVSTQSGNVSVTASAITENQSTLRGGGIFAATGSVNLLQSTVNDNITFGNGGGVATQISEVFVTRSTVTDNQSDAAGGGIFTSSGSVTLTESTIARNSAVGTSSDGGGVFNFTGEVFVDRSTVSENSSTGRGGGVSAERGALTLTSSTVSGNSAESLGGGIYVASADVSIVSSTVAFNNTTANSGGGLFKTSSATDSLFEISSSIIANNTASDVASDLRFFASEQLDLQFSLIGTNAGTSLIAAPVGSPDANGNLIGTNAANIDPLLDSLSDYGGVTLTHALLSDSPAIDSGSSTLSNDQRGFPFVRQSGNAADIGAVEFQRLELTVSAVTDTVDGNFGDGSLSLREAVLLANVNPGQDFIRFDPNQFEGRTFSDTIFLRSGEALTISESLEIDGENLGVVISGDSGSNDSNSSGDITDLDGSSDFRLRDNTGVFNITAAAGELVTLSGLTITGGIDEQFGGIANGAADLVINRSNILSNRSAGSGGGVSNGSGNVTIDRSTIGNNQTTGADADGGGLHSVVGSVFLTLSTVSGNQTLGDGANGGGIASDNGDLILDSVTVSRNSAGGEAGGVHAVSTAATTFVLNNTIVADNDAVVGRPDLGIESGGFIYIQSSLIGDNSGTFLTAAPVGTPDSSGNLIGTTAAKIDPLLGNLINNGGPTLTHELLAGSPAIDVGISTLVTDQRDDLSFPRNEGGGVDIGSFERVAIELVVATSTDVDDGDFSAGNLSLREALRLSDENPGTDTITFDPAVFNGEQADVIRLQLGALIINDGVDIDAANLGVVISGDTAGDDVLIAGSNVTDTFASEVSDTLQDNVGVIDITAGAGEIVTLTGLTITGGANTDDGGGIRNLDGDLELTDSLVAGNRNDTFQEGGGIYSEDGNVTLNNSTVSDNFSDRDGGGIHSDDGTITLNNSSVNNNLTGRFGDGGGITTSNGEVVLNSSSVSDNTTGDNGTGGGIETLEANITLVDSSVNNNTTGDFGSGGGISTNRGNVSLIGSSVDNNTLGSTTGSTGDGGGINSTFETIVSLIDSSVSNNTTGNFGDGGGIRIFNGSVTLTNSTVADNTVGSNANGGGIETHNGDVTLIDSTVRGNSTGESGDGGGIETNGGDVTLIDSTVRGNSAGEGGDGGGINSFRGDVSVTRSTLSSNVAGEEGGAVNSFDGSLEFLNSTLSGNVSGGEGGAIFAEFSGSIDIINSTITNNQSGDDGGGLQYDSGTLTIENSILAGNTTTDGRGPDLSYNPGVTAVVRSSVIGSITGILLTSTGTLLMPTGSSNPDANGNLIGSDSDRIDPLLAGLANNGGSTLTHGLLNGSPALNAGGTTSIDVGSTDQRGANRVQNGQIDIGAFEGIFDGPQVGDVILASSSFSPDFVDAIDGDGIGAGNGLGLSLVGVRQLTSVALQNIDTLYLQFLTDVSASLDDGDILLTGTNVGDYSLGPISFDTSSFVATVPILGGINIDSLVISIFPDTVTDAAGESIVDARGNQFNFRFNVLPGDEDGSGRVTLNDAFNIFTSNTEQTTAANASRDIDGSGQINTLDAFASSANNGASLPSPPVAPVPPATILSPLSAAAIDAAFSKEPLLEQQVDAELVTEPPVSAGVVPAERRKSWPSVCRRIK